jgi:hypothetical protein
MDRGDVGSAADGSSSSANTGNTGGRIQHSVDELVAVKANLNSEMKRVCIMADKMYKMTSKFSTDAKQLEKEASALPMIEDWIKVKVSEISQLKSQILFIHKIIEEDSY